MKNKLLKKISVIIVAVSLCITSSLMALIADAAGSADEIDSIIAGMDTVQKVAQMIMPEFRWTDNDQGENVQVTVLNDAIRNCIAQYGFGGIILFAQNFETTEQTVRLIDDMQKANIATDKSRPQLFISTDQEGGKVTRLATGTQFCGNMALAATGSLDDTFKTAQLMGQELKALGVNTDFAPVLDINCNPSNPVINVRSFSDDAQTVVKFGSAFLKGMKSSDTMTAVKHFPGHGDTATDSHTGLPMVNSTYEQIKARELMPFAEAVNQNTDFVMTAHIQFPEIEKETYTSKFTGEEINLPATLSKTILTDILRKDMGYKGLIITDSMEMEAIAAHFDQYDAARLAIEAGVDILLMPTSTNTLEGIQDLKDYVENVAKMVDEGKISIDRVNQSVRRILETKSKNGLMSTYDGSDLESRIATAKATVGSPEHHQYEWELAKKSLTLVKNDNNTLPIKGTSGKSLFLVPFDSAITSVKYGVGVLVDEKKLPNASQIFYESYESHNREKMLADVDGFDNVIIYSEMTDEKELNPAEKDGAISGYIDEVIEKVHKNGGKVIIVSDNLPYDSARYTTADAIMLCWSFRAMSEDPRVSDKGNQYGASIPAAAYMIFSPDQSPMGNLPLNIPALTADYKYSTTEYAYKFGHGLRYDFGGDPSVPSKDPIPDSSQTSGSDTSNGTGSNYATGDNSNVGIAIIVAMLCLLAASVVICRKNGFRS